MVDFSVIKIVQTNELIEHKTYTNIIITLSNLERYNVSSESALNFQSKLFYELNNIFWDPYKSLYIRIDKNNDHINYTVRITNMYMLKNVMYLKDYINSMLNNYKFKYLSNKRRLYSEDYITSKVQKINITT
jgi:hypothetical protein